ncbi:hypothetical protein GCM10007981_13480 [Thermocladium modestius]|uniref:DUF973 family protein n=1 Tax=Thermocladium modestius TaxID=62609 RepID=A0A830GWK6_9CREN|nr:DUF973 family protein [Thermocladium modestius]GGP21482.1 hypothetical protein GCM10007981_13480 [Thermocladium modestius]
MDSKQAVTWLAAGLLINLAFGAGEAVAAFLTVYSSIIRLAIMGAGAPGVGEVIQLLNEVLVMAIIGIAVSIATAVTQYIGFAGLSRFSSRYSIGKVGAVLGPVGSLVALPGLYLLINAVKELAINNQVQPTTPTLAIQPQPATILSALIPALILALVGGAVSLVGLVMIAIGYYRLGEEHGSDLVRVGAILYILVLIPYAGPVLSLIGFILLIVGVLEVRRRLAAPSGG